MNINTIDVGLNPIVLAQFRKLTRSELGEFRKKRNVLKVHRDNPLGMLNPLAICLSPDRKRNCPLLSRH